MARSSCCASGVDIAALSVGAPDVFKEVVVLGDGPHLPPTAEAFALLPLHFLYQAARCPSSTVKVKTSGRLS